MSQGEVPTSPSTLASDSPSTIKRNKSNVSFDENSTSIPFEETNSDSEDEEEEEIDFEIVSTQSIQNTTSSEVHEDEIQKQNQEDTSTPQKNKSITQLLSPRSFFNNFLNQNSSPEDKRTVLFRQKFYTKQENGSYLFNGDIFDSYRNKYPKRFRNLLRGGIPNEMRKEMWQRLVGSHNLPQKYPNLYQKLAHNESKTGNEDAILKDIHRTYPQSEMFATNGGPGQQALFRILKAYALMDLKVGYVQGMAFITGFFMMQMGEEESFWMLVQLCNNKKFGLKDVIRDGLPKLKLIMYSLDQLLLLRDPELHQHLNNEMVTPEMYASSFFITLGTFRFKYETQQRFFDIFLNEGWKMMIRTVCGVLRSIRETLLKLSISEIIPKIYDHAAAMEPEPLIQCALNVKLRSKMISQFAQSYENALSKTEKEKIQQKRDKQNEVLSRVKSQQIISTVQTNNSTASSSSPNSPTVQSPSISTPKRKGSVLSNLGLKLTNLFGFTSTRVNANLDQDNDSDDSK